MTPTHPSTLTPFNPSCNTRSGDDMKGVTENLLKGLPGTTSNAYSLEDFQAALDVYKSMPARNTKPLPHRHFS